MAQLVRVITRDALKYFPVTGLAFLSLAMSVLLGLRPVWADTPAELTALDALYPALDSLYIDLHQKPELSLHEEKTARSLSDLSHAN